jgi:hypothetical protein
LRPYMMFDRLPDYFVNDHNRAPTDTMPYDLYVGTGRFWGLKRAK